MCVLCMAYIDCELGVQKKLKVGIFLNENLSGNKQLF